MPTFVALLYSIGIRDGKDRLVMAEWRAVAEMLGLANPRTCLATGNLVFESPSRTAPPLEALLEAAHAENFGRRVDCIVRPAAAWRKVVKANPFPQESRDDPSHVLVRVNRKPVPSDAIATLTPYLRHGERLAVVGGDVWAYFGRGVAGSRLAAAMTPKRLGIGTSRNWNTVRQIGSLIDG